jgi:hypothetical protein
MPKRPPKRWMDRCTADVASGGRAADPGAVCGAAWQRKPPAKKRATLALEEGPMAKKKKKKHPKKKAAHKKPAHKKPKASKAPKRSKKKKPAKHQGPTEKEFLAHLRKVASGR